MTLSRPSTLGLAALLDGPAFWAAYVNHDLSPSTAWLRFLIAVPVAAVMLSVLRGVVNGYSNPPASIQAVAERLDTPGSGAPATPPADAAKTDLTSEDEVAAGSEVQPAATSAAQRADQPGGVAAR